MTVRDSSLELMQSVEEALEMLLSHGELSDTGPLPPESLLSLLEQCEIACAGFRKRPRLRTVHHFACTGGSLISKALFALPNIVLLSELDPLSQMMLSTSGNVPFAPTDVISALRYSVRTVSDDVLVSVFVEALSEVEAQLDREGRTLILRDHAHSQFCRREVDLDARPTLREMVVDRFDLLSVVTIRHPLDSFISLTERKWIAFDPDTLEEYSRRYLRFLDRHEGVPTVLYEDFVRDPEGTLKRISEILDLPYSPMAIDLIGAIRMTGDSGRSAERIEPRPRRPVPANIEETRNSSPSYRTLCGRFGYEP